MHNRRGGRDELLSDQPADYWLDARTFRHKSTDRVHAQFSNSTIQRLCFRSKRSQVQTMSPRRLTGTGPRSNCASVFVGRVAPQPGEGFGCTGLNRRQPWPRSFDGRTMRPIDVTIGELRLRRDISAGRLLPNTTTNRTTQEEQIQTFHNVAAQPQPGAASVIEDYIPELAATARGDHPSGHRDSQPRWLRGVSSRHADRDFPHHDWVIDGRLEMMARPHSWSPHRYVWPSELA